MTSEWREWDFDELHRSLPRVEYLPPRPEVVRVTIRQRRRTNLLLRAPPLRRPWSKQRLGRPAASAHHYRRFQV